MQYNTISTVQAFLPTQTPIVELPIPRKPTLTVTDLFVFKLLEPYKDSYMCGGWVRDKLLARTPADHDCVVPFSTFHNLRMNIQSDLFVLATKLGIKVKSFSCSESSPTPFSLGLVRLSLVFSKGVYDHVLDLDIKSMFPNETLDYESIYRDFTVNCLFYRPSLGKFFGRLSEFDDLKRKLISPAVNFNTMMQDPVRLLRAFRLSQELGFTLSNSMIQGLQDVNTLSRFQGGLVAGDKFHFKSKCPQEYRRIFLGLQPEGFLQVLKQMYTYGLYKGVKPSHLSTNQTEFVNLFYLHVGETIYLLDFWEGWIKLKVRDKSFFQISLLVAIALVSVMKRVYSLKDKHLNCTFMMFIDTSDRQSALKVLQVMDEGITSKIWSTEVNHIFDQTQLLRFGSTFWDLHPVTKNCIDFLISDDESEL